MIIELLLKLLLKFLEIILNVVSFPKAPDDLVQAFNAFLGMLDYSKTLLPLFIPINVKPYLIVSIALFGFEHLYPPIKWIINKIIDVIP